MPPPPARQRRSGGKSAVRARFAPGRVVLVGGNRLTLGKLGHHDFRRTLVHGLHCHLHRTKRFALHHTRSAVCIRPGSTFTSVSRTTSYISQIFNVTTCSHTQIARGRLRTVRRTAISCLNSRLTTTGAFGIRTGHTSGTFPLASPRLDQRINTCILRRCPRLEISIRSPSLLVVIRVQSFNTCIRTRRLPNTNNVPINANNHTTVLVSNNVSSPITTCVVTGQKVRLANVRFTSPPCADRQTRRGICSLLTRIDHCTNRVDVRVIPFARVRRRVHQTYPRRFFALVVHHFVVQLTLQMTHRRSYTTLVANRDINRMTDRAVPTLTIASTLTSVPMFHPLVNVSGRRVITVSHGVSAFRLSVRPFRSYYAIFAPHRPYAHPGLCGVRRTRTTLSISNLIRRTVNNVHVHRIWQVLSKWRGKTTKVASPSDAAR